jgi:putative transposase
MVIGYISQARELTALRAEFPWIRAVSQTMQQQALRDLDGAYQHFFRGEARYPRPRRRGENDSVRFTACKARVVKLNGTWSTVHVPNIGAVQFRNSRPTVGRCLNVTVSRDALGWHVSFACERETAPPVHMGPMVGIDAGIIHTMALSDGTFRDLPIERLNVLARRAKRAQRAAARGQRGSRRNAAAKAAVRRIQAKAARIRRHWQHETTSALARDFSTVVVEDLRVSSMTASARGTAEEPGRNVRQKAGLNRSILMQGWSGSVAMLGYKLPPLGGSLEKERAAYSSQTCRVCGHCAPENRESQAVFLCVACGHTENADTNAAGVLLGRYERRGSTPLRDVEGKGVGLPVKRQLDDD